MFGLHNGLFVITAMSKFIDGKKSFSRSDVRYVWQGETNSGSDFYDWQTGKTVQGWILKPGLAFKKEFGRLCSHGYQNKYHWCYWQTSLDESCDIRIQCKDWPRNLLRKMDIKRDMRLFRLSDHRGKVFGDEGYSLDWNS